VHRAYTYPGTDPNFRGNLRGGDTLSEYRDTGRLPVDTTAAKH